jgi:hypothetical protein
MDYADGYVQGPAINSRKNRALFYGDWGALK